MERQAFHNTELFGPQEFMGWRAEVGPVVFDEAVARTIMTAYAYAKLGQVFFSNRGPKGEPIETGKFMFKRQDRWHGWEGFHYTGLGEQVVYAIGEGAWEWEAAG